MSNLYRGPSIEAYYQISDQLALRFQRRRLKCEKLMDDGCQVMAKAHIARWAKIVYVLPIKTIAFSHPLSAELSLRSHVAAGNRKDTDKTSIASLDTAHPHNAKTL